MAITADAVVPTLTIDGKAVKPQEYRVVSVEQSMGGQRLDHAVLEVILGGFDGKLKKLLVDSDIRGGLLNRTCEISVPIKAKGTTTQQPIHFGYLEDAGAEFGSRPDSLVLVSKLQPYHFGRPLVGAHVAYHGDSASTVVRTRIDDPTVFNGYADRDRQPFTADEKAILPNRTQAGDYSAQNDDGTRFGSTRSHRIVPLELMETPKAKDWQEKGKVRSVKGWTLRTAAKYLCAACNDERHVKNPTETGYSILEDSDELPRTEMENGEYLPALLDSLLAPWGYSWFVQYEKPGVRRIAFLKIGSGPTADLKMQRPGSSASIDFALSNVEDFRANISISPAVNVVRVLGDNVYVEGTFPLYQVSPRRWVLNEAHDYVGSDSTLANYIPRWNPKKLFDANMLQDTEAINAQVMRRRRFLPCISLVGPDAKNHFDSHPKGRIPPGVEIEFYDKDKKWKSIVDYFDSAADRSVRILEDECGIEFDAPGDDDEQGEPEILQYLNSIGTAKLRITATLMSDWRVQITYRLNKGKGSIHGARDVIHVWDARSRYPCRLRQFSGDHASIFKSHTYSTETMSVAGIQTQMKNDARRILATRDAAVCDGSFVLNRIESQVNVGQSANIIGGRNLSLKTTPSGSSSLGQPTIARIAHDFIAQQTTLEVASDLVDPYGPLDVGRSR